MLIYRLLFIFGIIQDEGDLVLDVDASLISAAAVLQQYQEGGTVLRVLGYASRPFNDAEKAYCCTRREMSALIFGLKHFRPYLIGNNKVIVCTNHAALTYIRSTAEPIPQLARYLDFISQFNFELQYRNGSSHVNADFFVAVASM